jgi:hypothetical protein
MTMSNAVRLFLFTLAAALLAGCGQSTAPAGPDMAAMQRDMQEKTEDLLLIHLKLDTALTEIAKAEAAAQEGNSSAAGYHASQAYRSLETADSDLLDLGRRLQEMVHLDIDKR